MSEILAVTNGGEYTITISKGVLDSAGSIASPLVKGKRAFIVTDSNVAGYYLKRTISSFKKEGFITSSRILPPGENTKKKDYLFDLYSDFNEAGLTRSDLIVALGGGVIGDLAGFAASTYLRGVPIIQIPTTLLAQVDSSIGGKTGIDMPFGKNLVGAFHQPKAVITDPEVLSALNEETFNDGMAEVIKTACIKDGGLFEDIREKRSELETMIEKCVRIKTTVVQADERDAGERMLLNFGHTLGHAIEKVTDYSKYTHGQAVAIGMLAAARIGENLGVTVPGTSKILKAVLQDNSLPVSCDLDAGSLMDAMKRDKKTLSDTIYLVLLKKIGEAVLYPIKSERLVRIFGEGAI